MQIIMRKSICNGVVGIVLCCFSFLANLSALAQQEQPGLRYFVDAVCAYKRDRPGMTAEAAIVSYLQGFIAEVASNGVQVQGYVKYFSPTRNIKADPYNAGIAGKRFTAWQEWSRSLPPGTDQVKIIASAIRKTCT